MSGFEFRLESFLSVKEKLEEQKKLEYGKALNKLEEERQIKSQLLEQKQNLIYTCREILEIGVRPQEIQNYNRYIDFMKKKIRDQNILIEIAEKNAEEKRQELVNAMKERKMLDTLKEKDKVEYLKEQNKKEQKIVDEIVSYQYNDRT